MFLVSLSTFRERWQLFIGAVLSVAVGVALMQSCLLVLASTGKPHAINYFYPSTDAKYVAFGVSAAGSEDASIYIVETATRKRIGRPIERAQYPGISWHPDGKSFFFLRQQKLEPGMPATERYQDSRLWLHRLDAAADRDTLVLGPGVSPRIDVPRTDFPYVIVTPGSRYAVAGVFAGVQREITRYAAPLASVGKPGTPWVKICDRAGWWIRSCVASLSTS